MKLGNNISFHKPYELLNSGDYMPPGFPYWYKLINGKKLENLTPIPQPKKQTTIELREEQIPIYTKLLKIRAGLVEATTGIGKTVIMIALQEALQCSTLLVVHSKDMVNQVYEEFKKFRNIEIGRYNSDYKDIQSITVTTFNSFTAKPELFQNFKMLIIDECDTYFTPKARARINMHPAGRKYGFTGTIHTIYDDCFNENEKEDKIEALVKYWGYHVKKDFSRQKIENIFYSFYDKKYKDSYGIEIQPHSDWQLFRTCLDYDLDRKIHQIEYLKKIHTKKDTTLVLFDRVQDVENFYENFENSHGNKYIIHGSVKKTERDKIKKEFTEFSGNILFAQYKTSSRGVDYPECNKVVLFFPLKNESTLRQAIGRVIRFIAGKKSYIYDFLDNALYFQWNKRVKVYKEYFNINPSEISI